MRKSSMAICITLMFLLSSLGPALLIKSAHAADPADWYMTVNGVLDTDTYSLYPYNNKALLKVGLSKFGELIDSNNNVGLEYAGDRDPFAPVAGMNVPPELGKHVWINGWFIEIRYNHSNPAWGLRTVWAGALFADTTSYGGPWLRVDNDYIGPGLTESDEAFNLPGMEIDPSNPGDVIGTLVNGGRKTNGTVITDPLQVLYNGPRLFVAKITNHIYDWYQPSKINRHIVDLVLTVIFNKVKKEVIVLKDVKLVMPAKFEVAPLKVEVGETLVTVPVGYLVQLSNREEWDLGAQYVGTTTYSSYAHFYTAGNSEPQKTVYNNAWTMLPTLPADTKVKGVAVNKWGPEPGSSGTYDVAQIIANDKEYVGWHAFWPSVSDWSVTAGDDQTWYRALLKDDPHTVDGASEPWRSPLVVGEWDFMLSDQERHLAAGLEADVQFRGVSVYGITDRNNACDESFGPSASNVLDKELLYQLNEIFNPWDLKKAITKKDTARLVTFVNGPKSAGAYIGLGEPLVDAKWDSYCNFTERVLLMPDGILWERGLEYTLCDNDADGLTDGIKLTSSVASGKYLKILYSINLTKAGKVGRYEWVIVGRDAHTVDSAGAAMVAAAFKDKILESEWEAGAFIGLSGADMFDSVVANQMPWVMHKFTGDTWEDYYYAKGTDYRTALRDDWCRAGTAHINQLPIASSNMIGVGGPLANLLSYYANDFMTAIFALSDGDKYGDFTNYAPWENKIVPLTCWQINKTRAYSSSIATGYAVISTYKDINGTVIFLVWGHWGRDTYYACKFFHEEIIYELQEAPDGLNSIIIKIDYESTSEGSKPKGWSIVECLGTISETLWKHNSMIKGGIHDP